MKRYNRFALAAGIGFLVDAYLAYRKYYDYMMNYKEAAALALTLHDYYRMVLVCMLMASATSFYAFIQKKAAPLVFTFGLLACGFVNEPPTAMDFSVYAGYIFVALLVLIAIGYGLWLEHDARKEKKNRKALSDAAR